jgi:hypothetical protein
MEHGTITDQAQTDQQTNPYSIPEKPNNPNTHSLVFYYEEEVMTTLHA